MRHTPLVRTLAVVLGTLVGLGAYAHATSFDISGPTGGGIDAGGNVDFTLTTALTGSIDDINVRVTESGSWASDMSITLIHGNTVVGLFVATNDTQGVLDVVFDDAAGSTAPHSGNIVGTFIPDNSLSAFNGLDLVGDWTIRFNDFSGFFNDGDALTAWSIFGDVTTSSVPEPGTFALFGLGACALGCAVARRRRARNSTPAR